MKPFASSLFAAALFAGLASLLPAALSPVHAQTRSETEIREQYLADRAACQSRVSDEARRDCLREAGAAAQAARQGNLVHDEESYRRNALARCMPLPPEQREACRMRIEGAGTVRGSVEEGGVYRELRVREPAPQAITPAPAPAPTTTPSATIPSTTAPSTITPPATTPPPTTIIAPATATLPIVVAPDPAAPSTGMAPSTPSPAVPPVGAPGGPTFTPVQPVVPGRPAPAPAAVPADPSAATGGSTGGSTFSVAPPPSLQISPPAAPVIQAPSLPSGAPEPSMPQRPLVGPGSVPGSAR